MRIAHDLFSLGRRFPGPHSVTIGNFDGVHRGHLRLLEQTRERARELGLFAAAVTFEPHPQALFPGKAAPPRLTPLPRKLELLEAAGLDTVLVLPFTRSLASLDAGEFIRGVLMRGLSLRHLAIGYDYALGKDRHGSHDILQRLGREYGFSVEQIPPLVVNGEVVSSSRIRETLANGQVEEAARLLGRPHSITGTVIHGLGRGKHLGFPTVNLSQEDAMLPKEGVYAASAELAPGNGSMYKAIVNIGRNPTFGDSPLSLEAHLLDFSEDIYGYSVRLHFIRRVRDEVRFPNADALKQQLARDMREARELSLVSRPAEAAG